MSAPTVVVISPEGSGTATLLADPASVDALAPPDVVVVALGATYLPGAGTGPTVTHLTAVSDYSFHHALSYLPPVRLVDDAGLGVEAGVEYPTPADVYVSFPAPFTGTVLVG